MTQRTSRADLEQRIRELEEEIAEAREELRALRPERDSPGAAAPFEGNAAAAGHQENRRLLDKAQRLVNFGSWRLDILTNTLVWSDGIYRIFGLRPDEFESTYDAFLERVHPDDRDLVDSAYQSSLREGSEAYSIEHRIIKRDSGEVRYVQEKCEHIRDARGRVVGSEGIVLDITERKRAEMELRESRNMFQTLVDQTVDMLILHDLEGNILEANQKAVEQYGYSKDELLSLKVADLDPDYQEREADGAFWERFGLQEPFSFEARQRCKDGRVFPVEVTISKILIGGTVRIMGLCRDITERKEYEAALIRAKEQAEEASRAKSDFLAKMSHEIRTPMNSILGMHRLLLSGDLPAGQRERLQVAKESAESLLWLLNELLDLSRIETGSFRLHEKEFSPRRLLSSALKEMELAASEKGLSLHLEVDERLAANLIGDPHRLRQILVNLLNNAVKFTDKGWISLEAWPLDPEPAQTDQNMFVTNVLFQVRDTGRGIDPDNLRTIFESYEQGGSDSLAAEHGAGLGLAICRKLSLEMGGTVWAESRLHLGSTFLVRIPFKAKGSQAEKTEDDPDASHPRELPPLRVLLVEDQRMNQLFIVDLLTSHGHRIEIAPNGQQALEMLSKKSFDLVLMDVKMPVMDGLEAVRRIRTADPVLMNPDIPIIGLSAHVAAGEELERFQTAGFDGYVTKPISFESLFAAMQDVLEAKNTF